MVTCQEQPSSGETLARSRGHHPFTPTINQIALKKNRVRRHRNFIPLDRLNEQHRDPDRNRTDSYCHRARSQARIRLRGNDPHIAPERLSWSHADRRTEHFQKFTNPGWMGRPRGGGYEVAVDAGGVEVGAGFAPLAAARRRFPDDGRITVVMRPEAGRRRLHRICGPWQIAAIGLRAFAKWRTISIGRGRSAARAPGLSGRRG